MLERITYDPKILGGKPIIKGTRISVQFILELLAAGMTVDEIVDQYPNPAKPEPKSLTIQDTKSTKEDYYSGRVNMTSCHSEPKRSEGIDDGAQEVRVLRVAHRREVYR